MEDFNLEMLSHDSAVIVPTSSLASHLGQQYAESQITQGRRVWPSANILLWPELLQHLWSNNRQLLGNEQLIADEQASVLFTQVIEASARKDHELLLLNVPQTVRAVQSSWRLMNEWRISLDQIQDDHGNDAQQFTLWIKQYQQLLSKRGLIDQPGLIRRCLSSDLQSPFIDLYWHSYDLMTAAQQLLIQQLDKQGIASTSVRPNKASHRQAFNSFETPEHEIKTVLEKSKSLLEQDPHHTISIVIPDLQNRKAQVERWAADVFYPRLSPLSIREQKGAYRFSLGQPLADWPAVHAALKLLELWRGGINSRDFAFLMRNRYLTKLRLYKPAVDRWLARIDQQRSYTIMLAQEIERFVVVDNDDQALLELLQEIRLFQESVSESLSIARAEHGYASLYFGEWAELINDWLGLWGWATTSSEGEPSSAEYQLEKRWHKLLHHLSGISVVQRSAGLSRVIELLKQMARDAIFQPTSAASPIVICGVLEAIGREVDTLFLCGQTNQVPKPTKRNPFLTLRLLDAAGHPEARSDKAFEHQQKVYRHLLQCASNRYVSFAICTEDQEANTASRLFAEHDWQATKESANQNLERIHLERFTSVQGPTLVRGEQAKGGSRIFEDQSNCAFRAFAAHRLGLLGEQEVEFGLDAMDRGNVVHYLLDKLWQTLSDQSTLLATSDEHLEQLIHSLLDALHTENPMRLSPEKSALLVQERPRLLRLLKSWCEVEKQRSIPFSVVAREVKGEAELGGIRFRYIVDRIDLNTEREQLIIDYKTGLTDPKKWEGERIKSPQLPLYSLAMEERKVADRGGVAGIAFGQLKAGDLQYKALAEDTFFAPASRSSTAERWREHKIKWPELFERLAKDFLSGDARVNPIDESSCQFCDFHSFCRIAELQDMAGHRTESAS